MSTSTLPAIGDIILAQWAVGPAQRGSGWIAPEFAYNFQEYVVDGVYEVLGYVTVSLPRGGSIVIRPGQFLYSDEGLRLEPANVARECAMSRDFSRNVSPHALQADYEKHGNAWPFSGDHLGTQHVREEVYTPGVGVEPGDVIGRVRVHRAEGILWA